MLQSNFDEGVYEKVKRKLNIKLQETKDKIEQNRIRTKELGNQEEWIDWVEKWGETVGEMTNFEDGVKKEILEGIVDKIVVYLDKQTNDHHLDIHFKLPVVGVSIEFVDKTAKKKGYKVVDGSKSSRVEITDAQRQEYANHKRAEGRRQQALQQKKR